MGFIASLKNAKSHTIVEQVRCAQFLVGPMSTAVFFAGLRLTHRFFGACLQALTALGCMEHRGACSADDDSGDGAGLMVQIPWKLLKKEMPQLNELTTG